MSQPTRDNAPGKPPRKKYVKAIGPKLRLLFNGVMVLVAALASNSLYLAGITFLQWINSGEVYENYFYQLMFLAHLVLGLALIIPYLVFGIIHMKNSANRPNRQAVLVGYALFAAGVIVLVSGIALTRIDIFEFKNLGLKDPKMRQAAYWAHVLAPLVCVWLYVLHRLAGPRIQWKKGLPLAGATAALILGMAVFHQFKPDLGAGASADGEKYFQPSAATTSTGEFISAQSMMMDDYCLKCHKDAYNGWFHSSHHFSSFNNPFYLFSIEESRKVMLERDGDVRASRWCAGCHDPVAFFSGQFDNPEFDIANHPTAKAGITCTACHAITSIDSHIGNADYTISEPVHYPFAYSTNRFLQYINNQLVKAKPGFHNRTFLKDFMKTEEFCGTCHKVSLPGEVTHYKEWLRGQNHYDTFLLSGAGHGARSFYFPSKTSENCSSCHMPLKASGDFGADYFNPTNKTTRHIHSHLFASANTALPHIRGDNEIVAEHEEFSRNSLRLDIFGLREDGEITGTLTAPLRPEIPTLKKGESYLVEIVLRTLTVGHIFPQGTSDSNEIWVDFKAESNGRVIGRSGGFGEFGEVDPWSHFVNVYMLDKDGNRIDRRNAQDIFTPLYNNQMPPGTGYVIHYNLTVPEDIEGPITLTAKLNYRKFDTIYYNYVFGEDYQRGAPFQLANDLPVRVISTDAVTLPVEGIDNTSIPAAQTSSIVPWQRWNDYGIGLLLRGNSGTNRGELIQATQAFAEVEKLGRADGPVNLARVYVKEGRLDEAVDALRRASEHSDPAPPWLVAWLTGMVNKQNGFLDEAAKQFTSILEDTYEAKSTRGFDFSRDYVVINELGLTLFEMAKQSRQNQERQNDLLNQAIRRFEDVLAIDPENLTAHYNLGLLYARLGNDEEREKHQRLHARYKPDDNARDYAINQARAKNPAANHAAQAVVIYNLQREDNKHRNDRPLNAGE